MTEDTVDKLNRNMELSRAIGAPLDSIPAKAFDVVRLALPYLAENTAPREAAIVMAAVYLFFADQLVGDGTANRMDNAKELLDVTAYLAAQLSPLDD